MNSLENLDQNNIQTSTILIHNFMLIIILIQLIESLKNTGLSITLNKLFLLENLFLYKIMKLYKTFQNSAYKITL